MPHQTIRNTVKSAIGLFATEVISLLTTAQQSLTPLTTSQNKFIHTLQGPMVIYNLICKKKHQFEGWFPSFEDFQKQAEKKLISCPTCSSKRIEKMPHACAVHVKKEQPALPKKADQPAPTPPTPPSPADFKEMLLQVHHYIKQNFEDVGSRFAEEARQIHQGKAEERPIHGTATAKETADLAEEGVPFVTLPKPELDS